MFPQSSARPGSGRATSTRVLTSTHVPMHPCSHVPRSTCVPTYLYLHAPVSPCPVLLSQLLRPMETAPHPGRRNGNKFGARRGFLGSVSTGSMVTPALLSWEEGFGFSRCSSRSLRCSIEPTWSRLLFVTIAGSRHPGGITGEGCPILLPGVAAHPEALQGTFPPTLDPSLIWEYPARAISTTVFLPG